MSALPSTGDTIIITFLYQSANKRMKAVVGQYSGSVARFCSGWCVRCGGQAVVIKLCPIVAMVLALGFGNKTRIGDYLVGRLVILS